MWCVGLLYNMQVQLTILTRGMSVCRGAGVQTSAWPVMWANSTIRYVDTIRLQVQLCPFDHLEVSTVRCIRVMCVVLTGVPRKIFGSNEHLFIYYKVLRYPSIVVVYYYVIDSCVFSWLFDVSGCLTCQPSRIFEPTRWNRDVSRDRRGEVKRRRRRPESMWGGGIERQLALRRSDRWEGFKFCRVFSSAALLRQDRRQNSEITTNRIQQKYCGIFF